MIFSSRKFSPSRPSKSTAESLHEKLCAVPLVLCNA